MNKTLNNKPIGYERHEKQQHNNLNTLNQNRNSANLDELNFSLFCNSFNTFVDQPQLRQFVSPTIKPNIEPLQEQQNAINKAKLLQFDSSMFNQFNYQNDSFANDGFNQSQWVNNNTGFNSMPQVPLSQAKMSLRPGVFGYPTSDLLNLNSQQFQTDDQFQTQFNVIFNDF